MNKGPPNQISSGQLWAEVTQSPRAHRVVDFPRRHPATGEPIGRVAIWVLSQDERIRVAAAAERATVEALGKDSPRDSAGWNDHYENAAACELLCVACRDVNDLSRPAFPSAAEFCRHVSVDEVAVLLRSYAEIQAEIGPIVAEMTKDEVNAWVDRLVEASSTVPLSLLSARAAADLTLFMARLLRGSLTARDLPGSRSSDGRAETSGS